MRKLVIRLLILIGSLCTGVTFAGLPINLTTGWNLVGNSDTTEIDVATSLGDSTKITSVWKWNKLAGKWAFYAPSMTPSSLVIYTQSKGYDVLTSISPKDGFWVNTATDFVLSSPQAPAAGPGDSPLTLLESDLPQGWNLMANAYTTTPSQLTAALSSSLNTAGKAIVSFWAWDIASAKWRFYSPSLEAQGGTVLADYISSKGYLPFSTALSTSEGFWLNMGSRGPGVGGGTGTLTIIKDAQLDDPQDFHFTTVGAGLSPFDLDDDGTNANPLSNSITFTNLAAGVPFTVTEDAVSGWTVPSIQCLVAVPGLTTTFTDQLNRTFTVNLEAGANVTCTFINVKTTPTPTFTAGGPTLKVSTQTITPTVLMTSTAFTSTGNGNSGIATVTAGPTGVTNDGIFTLTSFVNPFPVYSLVNAIATLPNSILLTSGTTLPMASSSLGGTAGLAVADFGVWAITNAVPLPLPSNSIITYSTYASGAQQTATMPNISSKIYAGKMAGVLAHIPIGGSDDISNANIVSLTVNYASGTGTITGQITGINPVPGASTITPCVWPLAASSCTYNLYAPSQGLPLAFGNITVNGTITGNSFTATVTTPSIVGATITTMSGNFYGANADEIAGTFTVSVPSLSIPGPGMILIGSFGAK